MPVDQLATLSDPDLVHQALQLLTTENFSGSVRLFDGSVVSMRDCFIEFAGTKLKAHFLSLTGVGFL